MPVSLVDTRAPAARDRRMTLRCCLSVKRHMSHDFPDCRLTLSRNLHGNGGIVCKVYFRSSSDAPIGVGR